MNLVRGVCSSFRSLSKRESWQKLGLRKASTLSGPEELEQPESDSCGGSERVSARLVRTLRPCDHTEASPSGNPFDAEAWHMSDGIYIKRPRHAVSMLMLTRKLLAGGWRGHVPPGAQRRTISTLTPELLQSADFLTLAGGGRRRVTFPLSVQGSELQLVYFRHGINSSTPRVFTPFPVHACGFLYFAPQPALPALSASVRFRCTTSPDPASFAAGTDLALPNGLPWQILLAQAIVSKQDTLRAQLLREGHLTPASVAEWRARLGARVRTPPALLLFGPHQLFPVNFGSSLYLTVVSDTCLHTLELPHIFSHRTSRGRSFPYEGSALAHFALSPTHPHLVHLRIAKLVDPPVLLEPAAARIARPCADALFCVYAQRGPLGDLGAYRIGSASDERSLYAKYADDYDTETGEPWASDMRARTEVGEAFRVLFGREYLEEEGGGADATAMTK